MHDQGRNCLSNTVMSSISATVTEKVLKKYKLLNIENF